MSSAFYCEFCGSGPTCSVCGRNETETAPAYAALHEDRDNETVRAVTLRHIMRCTVATVFTSCGKRLGRSVVPGRHYAPTEQLYALMSGPDARFVPSRS